MSTPARGDAADHDEPTTDEQSIEQTSDEQDSAPAGAETPGEDDVRRKFREALARKQGHGSVGSSGRNGPAGHTHTGAAKPQRQFRRKSG